MPKNSLLVLGLMSGTSADGIEAALVRISGAPPKLNSKLLGHASLPIPKPIRAAILRVAEGTPIPPAEISHLNFRLAELFADAAIATCKKPRVPLLPPPSITERPLASHPGSANNPNSPLVAHFSKGRNRFDAGARIASRGESLVPLLEKLLVDPYLCLKPPKSTGREYFGRTFVQEILSEGRKLSARPEDLIRTATIFTALSVVDALNRFVFPHTKISQLIVSGGGSRNPLLIGQLEAALAPVELLTSEKFGVPEQSTEAYAFALLSYETFHQL